GVELYGESAARVFARVRRADPWPYSFGRGDVIHPSKSVRRLATRIVLRRGTGTFPAALYDGRAFDLAVASLCRSEFRWEAVLIGATLAADSLLARFDAPDTQIEPRREGSRSRAHSSVL